MNTKFFKSIAAATLAVLAMACAKEQIAVDSESQSVSFTIDVSGALATKAYGEAEKATALYYQVFDNGGNVIEGLGCQKTTLSSKKATVNFQLVKGQTYNFIFWAQTTAEGYYTIDGTDGLKKITANYDSKSANDENFDAFFATETMTITGPVSKTVTLKRPFAQINIASSDMLKAGDATVSITDFSGAESAVTVKQVPSVFAPLAAADAQLTDPVNVTFASAAIPTGDLTITGKTETYKHLAVNYVFAPAEGTVYDLEATLKVGGKDVSLKVPATPAKRNWRTNIYGSLLTATADFNVVVDPVFDGTEKKVGTLTEIAQEMIDNAEDGATIELVSGKYGTLYLRQTPGKSEARADLDKDWSYPAYYRSFKNVTIKAADGAEVVCDGIKAEAGLFYITTAPASNHAEMKEWIGSGKGGFISYLALENITIDGITFTNGKSAVVIRDNYASSENSPLLVDYLTIQNCKGEGNVANTNVHFFHAGSGSNDQKFPGTDKYALNNIVIKDNTMTGYYQPICHNNNSVIITGYTITGNTFKDCYDNQIQMTNKAAQGNFVISNNTFDGIHGRVIRMSNTKAGCTITFNKNKLANVRGYDTGGDGDIVKITGENGFTVNESENDWTAGTKTNDTTWKSMGDTSKLPATN